VRLEDAGGVVTTRAEDRVIRGVLMDRLNRHNQAPGLCIEHGGLMWSNAMRACITPDDVIRGGCRWQPFEGKRPGWERIGEVLADHREAIGAARRRVARGEKATATAALVALDGVLREVFTVDGPLARLGHVGWIDSERMLIPLTHRPSGPLPDTWRRVYEIDADAYFDDPSCSDQSGDLDLAESGSNGPALVEES
jgi:hypothetical protein